MDFAVPTGNFGDILAGFVASTAWAAFDGRLVIATNENDILARTLARPHEPRGVKPTATRPMDIQVSSNFERLLFEAVSAATARWSPG